MILCAMLYAALHTIFCTRLFGGKMHSDWFNGIEILQGGWQQGEKVGYCYPSGLQKTLCKWEKESFQVRWDKSIPLFSPCCHLP